MAQAPQQSPDHLGSKSMLMERDHFFLHRHLGFVASGIMTNTKLISSVESLQGFPIFCANSTWLATLARLKLNNSPKYLQIFRCHGDVNVGRVGKYIYVARGDWPWSTHKFSLRLTGFVFWCEIYVALLSTP
jgi:hypothetical protein